jgi:biopolymer transport protein ExbD
MRIVDRLQRRVRARRKCQPLLVVGVALETAMAGSMLTLLIILMVVVGFRPYRFTIPLELNPTDHAVLFRAATREDAIRMLITRDGALYYDSGVGYLEIRVADMADHVREKVREGSERRAYLMVDQRAHYGDVKPVIDAIRDGGVWNVSLVVGVHEPMR